MIESISANCQSANEWKDYYKRTRTCESDLASKFCLLLKIAVIELHVEGRVEEIRVVRVGLRGRVVVPDVDGLVAARKELMEREKISTLQTDI